jgi:tetratricopeptide (TPR) repeat protein
MKLSRALILLLLAQPLTPTRAQMVETRTRPRRAAAQKPAEQDYAARPAPPATAEARRAMERDLARARADYERDPADADAVIWYGRRLAYPGRFGEAVEVFTRGVELHPKDARLYRHRGHRYITLRRFDLAARDLERAAKLIRGKPDEIEPDGQPNARGVPLGTLHSNVWYHLGLAYYLQGDFKRAVKAYREGMKVSTNDDRLVSQTHWLYMALRRAGREREAARLLEPVTESMSVVENREYHQLLLMYKGLLAPERLLADSARAGALADATAAYGVGNWHLYNGRREEAVRLFKRVVSGPQWTSFGYIAAEADLKRLGEN